MTPIRKFYNYEHAEDTIHPTKEMFTEMLESSVTFNDRMNWNLYCKLYLEFARDVYRTWIGLKVRPDYICVNDGVVEFVFTKKSKVVYMSYAVRKSESGYYSYSHHLKTRDMDFVEKLKYKLF